MQTSGTPQDQIGGKLGGKWHVDQARAIAAYTTSGTTAARVARKRPAVPILALTPSRATSRRLSLLRERAQRPHGGGRFLRGDDERGRPPRPRGGFAKAHDMIVAAAGIPFHTLGNTNNIRVIQM